MSSVWTWGRQAAAPDSDSPASRVMANTVFRFTWRTSSQSSSGKFSTGWRLWIPPKMISEIRECYVSSSCARHSQRMRPRPYLSSAA